MSRVAVCICTCGRPAGLRRILDALSRIDHDGDLVVVVVDNHPDRSGLAVCAELSGAYRWQLLAAHEPARGISQARNRAMNLALEQDVAFIACLDDDEWPEPRWLSELLRVQAATGADAVGGPVCPSFVEAPPAWVEEGGYFDPPNSADGAPVRLTATGNFLVRATRAAELGPEPFDTGLSALGGEDTHFFHRLHRRGCKMAWARHAVAYEEIAPGRVTMEWLKERWRRYGSTAVHVDRMVYKGPAAAARRLGRTAAYLGFVLTVVCLAGLGIGPRHRAWVRLSYGLGRIDGHRGRLKAYYQQPGRP